MGRWSLRRESLTLLLLLATALTGGLDVCRIAETAVIVLGGECGLVDRMHLPGAVGQRRYRIFVLRPSCVVVTMEPSIKASPPSSHLASGCCISQHLSMFMEELIKRSA